jgi:ATP-binding cassette subfamily C (CFTR/MRP) protein 4
MSFSRVNLEQRRMTQNITINNTVPSDFEDRFFTLENCIYIYSTLIGLLIVFSTARSMSFVRSCIKASVHLHNKMFTSIVSATMRFFYTNSSGRILNRFSKDIGVLDEVLPYMLMDTLQVNSSGMFLQFC